MKKYLLLIFLVFHLPNIGIAVEESKSSRGLNLCYLLWKKLSYSLSPYGKILEEQERKQREGGKPAGPFPWTNDLEREEDANKRPDKPIP